MSKQTDLIEADIRSKRDALRSNAHELQAKAESLTDWRRHFKRHPGALLAAAVGMGALLATIGGRGSRRRSTISASGGLAADLSATSTATRREDGIARQIWNPLKEALVGAVVMRATGLLEDTLRGFPEQRTRDSRSHRESARSSGGADEQPDMPRDDHDAAPRHHRANGDVLRTKEDLARAARVAASTGEQETADERS